LDPRSTALLILLAGGAAAIPQEDDQGPAAADRAFAAHARAEGVAPAFLAVLVEGGALFRPQPIDGRALMREGAEEGELAWEPRLEVISAGGDLGFTVGPFTLSRDGQTLGVGHYLSVWTRPAGEEAAWRLLADIGVPHAPVDGAGAYPAPWTPAASTQPVDGERRTALEGTLRAVEAELARASAEGDGAAALLDAASEDLVAMRPAHPPAFGSEAAAELLMEGDVRTRMDLERLVLARSGDLAVTWGSLRLLESDGQPGEPRGGWLRIWGSEQAGWRALAEVRLPPPQ
jgi:ketosteroid isomerase-like protein